MQLLALIDFSSLVSVNYALASSRNASAKSMGIERGFTITLIDEPIEIGFPFDLPSRAIMLSKLFSFEAEEASIAGRAPVG